MTKKTAFGSQELQDDKGMNMYKACSVWILLRKGRPISFLLMH